MHWIPIYSSYLRVFGYTKHSLIGTVVGNLINIILNSVFLFVFNWGVMGVAAATVISRVVKSTDCSRHGRGTYKSKAEPERIPSRKILAQIVKIGFPSALETALYNVANDTDSTIYESDGCGRNRMLQHVRILCR